MSCAGAVKTFRLLDGLVGWDPAAVENLTGLDSTDGIRLAAGHPEGTAADALLPYLPPPRLARGCAPCEWFLLTPAPPKSRLLRRDACHENWLPLWEGWCEESVIKAGVAIAVWRRRLAVADDGAGRIWIWARAGSDLVGEIVLAHPELVAFTPQGDLLAVAKGSDTILAYSASGDARGHLPARPPSHADRLAVSGDCAVWISTVEPGGARELWRASRDETAFRPAALADLAQAFPKLELAAASGAGFCVERTGADGIAHRTCWSWYGRCLDTSAVEPAAPQAREKQGQLLTLPIDSGIPRCRWHRVRIDADVPVGCSAVVAVAASEESAPAPQGAAAADAQWAAFQPGVPHPQDWQTGVAGASDFLIDQPAGRYLFVRIRLTGDGVSTPVVRRVRIDFPRVTSLDSLPVVYRENADAEDFTERFLSLFDSLVEDLDSAIERAPALLDASGVPAEVLPWLASFFDITLEREWSAEQRRSLVRAAPSLYRLRVTPEGLKLAIEFVFGVTPEIQ